MDIKKYLQNKTNMEIEIFYDKPPVKSYIASTSNEKKLFIKTFDIKHHFNKEVMILKLLEREIIFTDEIDDIFILAVPYYSIYLYESLAHISPSIIKEIAKCIAHIHSIEIPENFYSPTLFELLDEYYDKTNEIFKKETLSIYTFFENKKNEIEKEESTLQKKLLHGSFMNDSVGYVDGKIELFNFEYSLIQTPWYEFVLGFNSRFGLGDFAETFLSEYTFHTDLQPISENMTYFLRFITLCKLESFSDVDRLTGLSDKLITTTKENLLNKLYLYIV